MEVLVVGNTAYVDDDFCAKAFPGDHVKGSMRQILDMPNTPDSDNASTCGFFS